MNALPPAAAPFLAAAAALLLLVRVRNQLGLLYSASPFDFEYIAEGALNVTVRYVGKDQRLIGRVLRLRKSVAGHRRWRDSASFVDTIMVPLLSRRYVPRSHRVVLPTGFVSALSMLIEPSRPTHRQNDGALDEAAVYGSLMYDHARLSCRCAAGTCSSLCFEIKPKWGFLPKQSREWPIKTKVDRFTMHQAWKRNLNGNHGSISTYKPLDLFSKERARVFHALSCLIATPQNNLRVFVDGRQAYPKINESDMEANGASTVRLSDVVLDADQALEVLADCLVSETVLERVQHAQNVGGEWDIESVWPYYLEMMEKRLTLSELYVGGLPTGPARDCVEIVRRFLISCTARDCSIMVALSRCPCAKGLGRAGEWTYDMAVCDLDSKPLGKMRHYYEMDRDICSFYSGYDALRL